MFHKLMGKYYPILECIVFNDYVQYYTITYRLLDIANTMIFIKQYLFMYPY
jgi:hypothetical protein